MNYLQLVIFSTKKIIFLFFVLFISLPSYALTPYSTKELDDLEKEFIQQINQSSSVERNPLANQYINELGKQLAKAAHLPTPHFFIVKSNEINAFAGPGGHIGINTGLILATDSDSELAAVMGHELAHVRLHHLYRLIQHEKQMRIPLLASLLAAAALSAINPTLASGAMMASLTGFAQDNINFTRANEKEADNIGMQMLINSNLNPEAMVSFFKKMQQHSRYYYTANVPAILRTHPLDEDRITQAENRIFRLPKKNYLTTLDYQLFKEIIRNTASDTRSLTDYYQRCLKVSTHDYCEYGYSLTLLDSNQPLKASLYLTALLKKSPSNLFYQLAYSQSLLARALYQESVSYLAELQVNFPDNYAVLMVYAEALVQSQQYDRAVALLLKGFRHFKTDLPLCEALAQAQAKTNRKGYAYFTKAQCYLLQGLDREALRQLKWVKSLARHDSYLLARTDAMIEEIKFKNS